MSPRPRAGTFRASPASWPNATFMRPAPWELVRSPLWCRWRATPASSFRPGAHAPTQHRREYDRIVMHLVARPEDERHASPRRERCDLSQQVAALTQLPFVAPLELGPLLRIVSEPPPQRRGWRELFHPLVDCRTRLTQPTGPESVDENAPAIRAGGRL